eukprot:6211294-Pleurochrysis_carterae.AAC.2
MDGSESAVTKRGTEARRQIVNCTCSSMILASPPTSVLTEIFSVGTNEGCGPVTASSCLSTL